LRFESFAFFVKLHRRNSKLIGDLIFPGVHVQIEQNVLNNYRLSEIVELIRPYYKPIIEIDPQTQKYLIFDRFGFIHKEMNEKEAFLQQVLIEILNSK